MKKFFQFCIVFFVLSFSLLADRVIFNNREILECYIQSIERDTVTIKTKEGNVKVLSKRNIAGVFYNNEYYERDDLSKVIPAGRESSQVATPEETKESGTTIIREKIIEKGSSDPACCQKFIDKFGDIETTREENNKRSVDILKEEIEYLKEERNRKDREKSLDDEFKKNVDKRLTELEIRNRRLEKYLNMDEQMVDYYNRKRSPWDLVWRSTVFPGWGHRYAKEDYTGNAYSTAIMIAFGLGYFIQMQSDVLIDAATDKLITDYMVRSTLFPVPNSLSNTTILQTFGSYQSSVNAVNSQKKFGGLLVSAAVGLYVIQIVHSFFTGLEWSKSRPRDYSKEELIKPVSGFDIHVIPDNINSQITGRVNNQIGTRAFAEYRFVF